MENLPRKGERGFMEIYIGAFSGADQFGKELESAITSKNKFKSFLEIPFST